jgi:hypothetical protein
MDELAVACCLALEIRVLPSARLPPFDCVELNPFPAIAAPADTVPSPNTNSLAKVGIAMPLSGLLPVPIAGEVIASGEWFGPLYSTITMLQAGVEALNLTVTVFALPPAISFARSFADELVGNLAVQIEPEPVKFGFDCTRVIVAQVGEQTRRIVTPNTILSTKTSRICFHDVVA